jgi:hypothetical protein
MAPLSRPRSGAGQHSERRKRSSGAFFGANSPARCRKLLFSGDATLRFSNSSKSPMTLVVISAMLAVLCWPNIREELDRPQLPTLLNHLGA